MFKVGDKVRGKKGYWLPNIKSNHQQREMVVTDMASPWLGHTRVYVRILPHGKQTYVIQADYLESTMPFNYLT